MFLSPKRQFFLQTMNRATFDDVTDVKKPLKTKIITFPHFKVLDQEKKIVGLSKKKKIFRFPGPDFFVSVPIHFSFSVFERDESFQRNGLGLSE